MTFGPFFYFHAVSNFIFTEKTNNDNANKQINTNKQGSSFVNGKTCLSTKPVNTSHL